MERNRFRYELPTGCDIASITIRETSGKDERAAAAQQKAKGGDATYSDELVRISIAAVDDKSVEQPFPDYDDWNTKTRRCVFEAFQKVNGVSPEEERGFLGKATLVSSTISASTNKTSGTSSSG